MLDLEKYEAAIATVGIFLQLKEVAEREQQSVYSSHGWCDKCYLAEIKAQDALITARNQFRDATQVDLTLWQALATAYAVWQTAVKDQKEGWASLSYNKGELRKTEEQMCRLEQEYKEAVYHLSVAPIHDYDGWTEQELSDYVDGMH